MFKNRPRGPAGCVLRRIVGQLLRWEADKRDKALLSAPQRNRSICPASKAAGPRGERDAEARAGCHANSGKRRRLVCRGCNGAEPGTGHDARLRFADSDGALGGGRDCEAVQRLSTQVVSNTRRKNSPMTTRHVACKVIVDACQEYEELPRLASGESRAKTANIRACSSTVFCKGASLLEIDVTALLKSSASRQEKASRCNGNGASSYKHFRHFVACDLCGDVNATRPTHLDSLLDHHLLSACGQAMSHKPRDGAAGGRAGCWILAVVELHACMPVGS